MHKSFFQALAFIPQAANFLVRVNLISQGIKGSRRKGRNMEWPFRLQFSFSLSLDFSHLFTFQNTYGRRFQRVHFPLLYWIPIVQNKSPWVTHNLSRWLRVLFFSERTLVKQKKLPSVGPLGIFAEIVGACALLFPPYLCPVPSHTLWKILHQLKHTWDRNGLLDVRPYSLNSQGGFVWK